MAMEATPLNKKIKNKIIKKLKGGWPPRLGHKGWLDHLIWPLAHEGG
jgi:hypothetical protein